MAGIGGRTGRALVGYERGAAATPTTTAADLSECDGDGGGSCRTCARTLGGGDGGGGGIPSGGIPSGG
jgi:hypothetical protein